MNKTRKGILTVGAPLILLWIGAEFMPYMEQGDVLPTLPAPRYLLQLVYYLLFAAYLYWFCRGTYEKKEFWMLIVPLCYLLFMAQPYGWMWENSMSLFEVYQWFFPGYGVVFILFFLYLFRLIALWTKGGKDRLR